MEKIDLIKFNKSLSSRVIAHDIFDKVGDPDLLVVDFKGVEEASPSFCHEMLSIILNRKKLKMELINVSDSIKFQLDKARASFEKI